MRPLASFPILSVTALALAVAAPACKKAAEPAPSAQPAAAPSAAPSPAPSPAPAGHGDHNPKHGGFVLMDATSKHLEIVFKADGGVELWPSDAVRKELPASTLTSVKITLTPAAGTAQVLELAKDPGNTFWAAKGQAVTDPATKVKLDIAAPDYQAPYQNEIDYAVLTGAAAGGDPAHAAPKGPHGGLLAAIEGGQAELVAATDGNLKLWLLDDKGAARPVAGAKARVKVALPGYVDVALVPMGDHLHGKGAALAAEHAAAIVVVERAGKAETARFELHLEGHDHGKGDGHDHGKDHGHDHGTDHGTDHGHAPAPAPGGDHGHTH